VGSLIHVNNDSTLPSLCQVYNSDFSRADKPLIFVIPSGLQAARDLLFRLFQQPVKPCPSTGQTSKVHRTALPGAAGLQLIHCTERLKMVPWPPPPPLKVVP
jgi:hypothetical protein